MNFQQLRTFRELTRRGFSLTEMASVSQTTQPGLTRQIRDLESELGLAIFERHGNRITGLSEAGRAILQIVNRLLIQADQLLCARDTYETARSGTLTIATTHTQARYALPDAIMAFRAAFPKVRIELRQCATEQIARLVMSGAADIGIAGSALAHRPELATFPCTSWRYQALVPDGHPLLARETLTLQDLAAYPILTYDRGLAGRQQLDEAFASAGLDPDIVLTSMDSDVIKQYVALDFGVGLLAPLAFDAQQDAGLRALDTGTLFAPSMTLLALRRGSYIRSYAYEFILRFLPQLTRAQIDRAAGVVQADGGRRGAARKPVRETLPPAAAATMRKENMHARI
jgi:LysR family cys regulon transcriptional activator